MTSLADSGPGSLREGAERPGPLRIRAAVDGDIDLVTPLHVREDKTIDGRGASIGITGNGLVVERPNVILENLRFGPFEGGKRQDAVTIRNRARGIWIDHCTFRGAPDKAIEILGGATDITVSWSSFVAQEQVIQAGAFETRDSDADIRVTVHHNLFDRTGYRSPRISYGKAHAYNNVLRSWTEHGMSARREGQLASEANVFEAGGDRNAIELAGGKDDKDDTRGFVRSTGDLALNGAEIKTQHPERVFDPAAFYQVAVEPADRALVDRIVAGAGWQGSASSSDGDSRPPAPAGSGVPRPVAGGLVALAAAAPVGMMLVRRRTARGRLERRR